PKQFENWERAVELYRGVGTPWALGLALSRHSRTFSHRGEFDQAARLLDEARNLVEADGGTKLLGAYHTELAFYYQMTGDLRCSYEHYDKAYGLFKSVGAINVANQLLGTLADARWALGD